MRKILVGVSGGVDSSVTALLLKNQGYEVIGVTLDMWERSCGASDALNDAREVCAKLGIEYHVLDFRKIFKKNVIDYFAKEYMEGRTPNPCNVCNRYVKFEALLNEALSTFNCDFIATGHYSKVDFDENTGRYFLRKSVADKKDQTYALYDLTQEQLKHIVMPLGDYTKEEVREIAEKNGLVNAKKRDSQEICFVEDNDYVKFIKENYNYKLQKGNFVDIDGKVIGSHNGIINYTIGQRKGLGIALGKHVYVIYINVDKNEVVLGDEQYLFSDSLICKNVNLMRIDKLKEPVKAGVKIRYASKPESATLIPIEDNKIKVVFDVPQRAITKGQAAVFYDGDAVIGGAVIC